MIIAMQNSLEKKLSLYRSAVIVLTLAIAILFTVDHLAGIKDYFKNLRSAKKGDLPPYYNEVMQITNPLVYSGLQSLVDPAVTLSLDFKNDLWYLKNVHRFDSHGDIILDANRYGLCGELAAYVFRKVQPLFKNNYKISFARVAESGFFLNPEATHVVLLITEQKATYPTTYIIDPSFHRYGNLEDYDDYLIFETTDTLVFLESKLPDVFFKVGHGTPVLIENDFLVSLAIEKSEDRFDKNNFTLALLATQRYKYSGRYLLALRNDSGKTEIFENKPLIKQILNEQEYELLRKQLFKWFEEIYTQ